MAVTENNKPKQKRGPKKGAPSPNPNGRPKGTPNKTTTALKEAILLAAAKHGYNGSGQDGLEGYLLKVASEDIKAFTSLLGKVLPLQLVADMTVRHADVVAEIMDPDTWAAQNNPNSHTEH